MKSSSLPPSGPSELAVNSNWTFAARLGISRQPPKRTLVGQRARIRSWHRIYSAILLVTFVIVGGLVFATAINIFLFVASFLIEQAIG